MYIFKHKCVVMVRSGKEDQSEHRWTVLKMTWGREKRYERRRRTSNTIGGYHGCVKLNSDNIPRFLTRTRNVES